MAVRVIMNNGTELTNPSCSIKEVEQKINASFCTDSDFIWIGDGMIIRVSQISSIDDMSNDCEDNN
ncbi:hypothetical protein FC35_GL000876 [Limosilactobacillus coleohominis DSM 14060]|nr:hypothetical protein FC35_GL000876 [Limosilactobacillus coleohominis DSM 14060]